MRPLAPAKKAKLSGTEVAEPKEEPDEVVINLKDNSRKKISFQMPGGKTLRLDIKFELKRTIASSFVLVSRTL